MRNILAFILLVLLAGCNTATMSDNETESETIGSVEMEPDGTLKFMLRAETNGTIGDGYFKVRRTDKEYTKYLEHVQPISPGESKMVKPWE